MDFWEALWREGSTGMPHHGFVDLAVICYAGIELDSFFTESWQIVGLFCAPCVICPFVVVGCQLLASFSCIVRCSDVQMFPVA